MFVRTLLRQSLLRNVVVGGSSRDHQVGKVSPPDDQKGRPVMSTRDRLVEELAVDVFSRGNKILKVVEEMTSLPEGRHSFPEVCMVGKPNCGKSSLIGALCHNFKMGRSGTHPGQTKKLEFFNIGDGLLLVDTPGYGTWERASMAKTVIGVTSMRRYISLRKQSNLKHVYWLLECPDVSVRHNRGGGRRNVVQRLDIGPRDEEMLQFLVHERVPFTVLLSKVDRLRGNSPQLHSLVDDVHHFIHTDKIPVMPVAARKGGAHLHELMCDIVDKCTQDLSDNEINFKGLHSLSYLPPSAQDVVAVEARYPHGGHVLPVCDKDSIESIVQMHKEARLGFVQNRMQHKLFSSGQLEKALKLDGSTMHTGARLEENTPAHMQGHRVHVHVSDSITTLREEERSAMVERTDPAELPLIAQSVNTTALDLASLLPSVASNATDVSNVLGVAIPTTMIGGGINRIAQTLDQSAEAYAAMIEAQGYDGVLNATNDFFVVGGKQSLAEMDYHERKRGPRYDSHLGKSRRRLIEKFVKRTRKDRSVQLDAQGYMCPWLGGNIQASRVQGNDAQRVAGRSVGIVRNLKQTGFGGQSLSRKTLKNTGRATKKVGFWAT
jgi:GTP-binding protein EngB required for normal cell division